MAIQQQSPHALPVERATVPEQGRYNFRAAAAVGFIVGVIDVLIAGRFLLKLLGASTESSFVNLVYGVSSPLVAPSTASFRTPARLPTASSRRPWLRWRYTP
jgi:hypothetical protein